MPTWNDVTQNQLVRDQSHQQIAQKEANKQDKKLYNAQGKMDKELTGDDIID
jgi:hypothetical protein